MNYHKALGQYHEALESHVHLRDRLLRCMCDMPGYGELSQIILFSSLGECWSAKHKIPGPTYNLIEKQLATMPTEELPEFFIKLMEGTGVRHKGVFFTFNKQAIEAVRDCLRGCDKEDRNNVHI